MMAPLSFDDFLTTNVGASGPWQWSLFLLITFAADPPIIQFPQLATLAPPHRCAAQENATWTSNLTAELCKELRRGNEALCLACEAPDNSSGLQPCPALPVATTSRTPQHSVIP